MLASSVWADVSTHTLEFAGTTFHPEIHEIQGRQFYRTDDEAVLSLISLSNVSAQWSSSGHTMFAFAPGRESYWSVGSELVKVNGVELPTPGQLIIEDGRRYIEPSALFYALATKGVPTEKGFALHPVITGIAAGDGGFLLRSATRARPKSENNEDKTVLSIEGFAWDNPQTELSLQDTTFQVSGGADQGQPLQITVTPPPFNRAKLTGATLLNETKLDLLPNFPGAEYSAEVVLESLTAQRNNASPMLMLSFNRGAKVHYLKDSENNLLKIFVPKGSYQGESFRSSDWPGLEVAQYNTALYPVLEISVPLQDETLEFVQVEGQAHTLALLRGSSESQSPLAASGSVETPGWMQAGGTIVIDPGHGGSDPGCVNRQLGTREADVTLKISKHLAEILRAQGWNVVLTRETDRDVTYAGSPDRMELEARSGIANQLQADLFISIHCNASVGSHHRGSSIHWWKAEDYEFAQALEPMLGHAIGFHQKGLIRNRFVVLRHAQMPSVLVETAFLTNPTEGAMLSNPEVQKTIAAQLARGLASYSRGRYASNQRRPVE